MPTSLNLLDLFSSDPSGYGPTQTLDMTQPAFANTLAAYKTTHQQALIGILNDPRNSSINKDEFYIRAIFSYVTTILEAGLTPDPKNWTQMVDAIKAFSEKSNTHDPTKPYKKGARVQNGLGGAWYEAVQDVDAGEALTNNPTFWVEVDTNSLIQTSSDLVLNAKDHDKTIWFSDDGILGVIVDLPPPESVQNRFRAWLVNDSSVIKYIRSTSAITTQINNIRTSYPAGSLVALQSRTCFFVNCLGNGTDYYIYKTNS